MSSKFWFSLITLPLIFVLLSGFLLTNYTEKKADDGDVADKPNVIIIMADDLGYRDVGFNGSKEIPTPNIDRIAQNGVRFTNGYVSYAVCSPSRAGMITGRYQGRFGYEKNVILAPDDSTMGLPLEEKKRE